MGPVTDAAVPEGDQFKSYRCCYRRLVQQLDTQTNEIATWSRHSKTDVWTPNGESEVTHLQNDDVRIVKALEEGLEDVSVVIGNAVVLDFIPSIVSFCDGPN